MTIASSYANRATPAALGRTMLHTAYLQTTGLEVDEADQAVATGSAAGAVVHLAVFVLAPVGVLVAPHPGRGAFDTAGGVAAVLAVVILACAVAWWRGDRREWAARLRRGARGLRDVLDSPARAARLFGGSAVVTLRYTIAFTGATLTVIPHTAGLGGGAGLPGRAAGGLAGAGPGRRGRPAHLGQREGTRDQGDTMTTPFTEIPGYVAGTWDIDPVHSHIGFQARHMFVHTVRGHFETFEGQIITAADPCSPRSP